jgi:heptosyltransferase-2
MAGYLLLRFSSLGDVILATAAARLIKERRPAARVVFATKAAFAPILSAQPDLDDVWPLEPGGLLALAARARAERFDAVVDLHANPRSRLVSALSGSPVRRWSSQGWRRRLRVWAPFLAPAGSGPVSLRYARAAAAALGGGLAADQAPAPRLGVDAEAAAWAGDWLAGQGLRPGQKLLAVAPGAAWANKRWGAEHLAQCLDLVSEFDRVRFLLIGSAAEAALLDRVQGYQRKSRGLSLRSEGETGDLRRLAALLARCDAYLGMDSGPLHAAEALGVPVTALFGPTVRDFGFFPQAASSRVFERPLACRPCSVHGEDRCPLRHHDCMGAIEPFTVAQHLRRVLGLEPAAA